MKQGEIWQIYFDPVKGSEQSGRRPAVIISGNLLNRLMKTVIVCPMTTSIHHYEGNPVLKPNKENGLEKESEILVFHIRSVSKERLKKQLGTVDIKTIDKIKNTLNDILKF